MARNRGFCVAEIVFLKGSLTSYSRFDSERIENMYVYLRDVSIDVCDIHCIYLVCDCHIHVCDSLLKRNVSGHTVISRN